MVAITTPMNISQAVNLNRLIKAILVMFAVAAMQIFLVSAFVAIGSKQAVSENDNLWLTMADALSLSNPDVSAAVATYQREQAVLLGGEKRRLLLTESLANWEKAIEQRPLWPYHQLNALHVEVMLREPAQVIQNRIQYLMTETPNERGVDKYLLELAVFAWRKLTFEQRRKLSVRLNKLNSKELKYVLNAADKVKRKTLICGYLPLKKARRACRK